MTLPQGTVTFLRSDIEGSMDLVLALGARYDDLNAQHQGLVRTAVAEHSGQVVRTEGDAFFVVFIDAGAAARAAVDIQLAMDAHPWPKEHPFKLRIGIHVGVATRAGDDYGGFEVNRAARISALGWGGQIILSDPARALIAADLPDAWEIRDLGHFRLKGIVEPERLFQLEAPGLAPQFPGLRGEGGAAQHLPARLTSFIGREEELRALGRLLGSNRLLTLTGPGGTGKTTLALELARRHATHLPDGTWFVDLQSVREPAQVRAEIAHGLGLFDGSTGSASDRLLSFVADRRLLIIIDNFEQVIEAADVVAELLSSSTGSRVIVTSRGPLRISGEQEYPVSPLSAGDSSREGESEAVRLFVDRVRRVRPTQELSKDDLANVREACRLLDGLPLAIELTAARASALPLKLICERLRARVPLPGAGPRDLPERQRTIDATVAWSYDLLDPPLQRLFARLAVFEDSFDLEQAEAVAGSGDDPDVDPLDGLFHLSEQGLLARVDDAIGSVRFRMLETIRTNALSHLRESGADAEVRERHARAYATLAESAATHLPGNEQGIWIDRLEPDAANLRAAASSAIEGADVELAVRCAALPWRFWVMSGRLREGADLTDRILGLPESHAKTTWRVRLLNAAGSLAYWAGHLEQAHRHYEEQCALATELGDDRGRAEAHLNLAYTLRLIGDAEGALAARAKGRRLYEQLGDENGILMIDWALTFDAIASGERAKIEAAQAQAAKLEEAGGSFYLSLALTTRSMIAIHQGETYIGARDALGVMRLANGMSDFAQASYGIQPLVGVLAAAGSYEDAAVAHGSMELLWRRFGVSPAVQFWELIGQSDPIPSVRSTLGDEAYEAALERGRRLTVDELLDHLEIAIETLHTVSLPRQDGRRD